MKTKLLFVCSENKWRSPTAESLFRGHPTCDARSAGTESGARVRLTEGHIGWADIIYCMEEKHAERIRDRFGDLDGKSVVVLEIPDRFGFMDPNLLEILRLDLAEHFIN